MLVLVNVNVPETKNIKMFGYVHVYEHEHVHVISSKGRPQVSYAALPQESVFAEGVPLQHHYNAPQ
jgi:hypothetical protein